MNFTLHQLRIFLEVVSNKSISRAADKLNMTQPAVSIQLKNLQDQFDIPLTEVIGKRLYVTEFGYEMAQIAEDILSGVSAIAHKTMLYKGLLAGKLKISAVSTGKYIMPYFLTDFLGQHPHVELQLHVSQRESTVRSLEENAVDFALVTVLPAHLEVEEELLLPNKLFMVAAKDFAMPQPVSTAPEYLENTPIIYREKGSGTRLLLEQYLDRMHTRLQVKLELNSTEAVKQAVMAGLGVSVMSVFAMQYELAEKAIQILPLKGFPLKSHWRLIWLKSKKLSPVAQAYLSFIRQEKAAIIARRFSWIDEF